MSDYNIFSVFTYFSFVKHGSFLPFSLAAVFEIKVFGKLPHIAAENGAAQSFHEFVQEGDVVQTEQHRAVHFPHVHEVTKICFRVMLATITVALLV